jgi:L-iditol 2-dehydrogenase
MLRSNMNAAVYEDLRKIIVKDVQTPSTHNGSVLVKTLASAICGYDVRVYNEGHRKVIAPVILGHEVCAVTLSDIVLPGKRTIRKGTRVSISPIIPCLRCYYCNNKLYNLCDDLIEIGSTINGGFAEFIEIPANNLLIGGLIPIPDSLTDEEGSLIEPLACCLNSHLRLNPVSSDRDRDIVIIGDGPVGLIHLQISKLYGGRTIVIGKIQSRIDQAMNLGARTAFLDQSMDESVKNIMELTDNIGASIVIVATSSPEAADLAFRIVGKNSKISFFAGMPKDKIMSVDPNWIHYNQITISGSFSSTPTMARQAIKLVEQRRVDLTKIISHKFSIFEIEKALATTKKFQGLRSVINSF